MKKKILAVFLSLCMAMSLLPVTALAAGNETGLPAADENGVITLKQGEYVLSGKTELSKPIKVTGEVTLDLSGYTLKASENFSDDYFITISTGGSLTIRDSGETGKVEVNETYNGTESTENTQQIKCVKVCAGAAFTLESGTITNTNTAFEATQVISNYGTTNIEGGVVKGVIPIFIFNPVRGDKEWTNYSATCNVSDGNIEGVAPTTYRGSKTYQGTSVEDLNWSYGIGIYGPGVGSNGTVDNTKSILNITGGTITAGQAIGTNASNGRYAGYTINMYDGTVDGGSGTGMYLPAIGVTNISGGTVKGAQAIRIAAGELNITDGTIIGTSFMSENTDLISGGSGGTEGAIVVGKASSGYVGDVKVNISGTAKVVNTAEGTDADTRPAIVVSDKNMSNETMGYDDLSITVNVDGATITGDVVKVSNLSGDNTKDGGNTSLMIQNTTVEGDVTNQSKTGVTILDSTVNGTVRAISGDTLVLGNSRVEATDDSEGGSLYVENSESSDNKVVAVNNRTATTYDDLAKALTAAQDGDTITLMKDIENLDDGSITQPRGVYTITKAITLNGNGHSISVSADFGDANIINVENSGTVAIKDLTVNGNGSSHHCINIFSATDTNTPSEVTLENVVTTGGKTGVTIGGSTVTIKGADTNIATGAWSAVNVDSTSSSTREASLTVVEGTIGAILLENTAGTKNVSTAVQGGNIASITTENTNTSATVTGGTFNESVAEYVDTSRLKYESNLNGTYTYYGTLEDALATGGIVQSVETAQVADADKHILKLMNNGDVTAQIVLASNEPYELPTLPNQGYNRFQGWRSSVNGEVYPGGQEVTISADTTFTAQWAYIPPANPNYRIDIPDFEGGTVTADPTAAKAGAKVTLTATPDEGYAVGTITVTDRFGDAVKVTENADGTYTFTMPNGQVTVKATFVETEEPAPAEPFPDVDENDWFYDEVVYVYENGLMNGVENNQFAPNTATNRAMLATILYRLAGEPAVSGDLPFTDVESGTWYTDAVLWAAQNGIVNGLGENTFAPMNTLTREQLVTMLYRYAEAEGYDVSAAADLSGYPDADKVQTYAQEAMTWAVAEGIVEGMDGNLNPAGHATRAQIATILMRFCETVAE